MGTPNPLTYAFKWLFNQEKGYFDTQYVSPIDNECQVQNKAKDSEIGSLKGQLAKRIAEDMKAKDLEKSRNKKQEIIKDLESQKLKISKERFGEIVDLGRFFTDVYNGKVKIDVTDCDDRNIFGQLSKFVISSKTGNVMFLDPYNNVISIGNMSGLILKPETIGNQLKRKRILTPRDENFNMVRNIEDLEVGKLTFNEDEELTDDEGNYIIENGKKVKGVWHETEFEKIKVREYLIEQEERIRDLADKNKILEISQVNQKRKIDDLNQTLQVFKLQKDNVNMELTNALNISNQAMTQIGDFQRENNKLTQYKALLESEIAVKDSIIEKLYSKIAEIGGDRIRDQLKEEVYSDVERMKRVLPESVNIIEPEIKPERRIPKPGEVAGTKATAVSV